MREMRASEDWLADNSIEVDHDQVWQHNADLFSWVGLSFWSFPSDPETNYKGH